MGKGLCLGLVLLLAFGLGEGELEVVKKDVPQLSGWIIGSPKHTRYLVGGGCMGALDQMSYNPTYI